ncbi:hypothetical protein HanRHA438_Chr11g0500391 [Helianthus annuus]|nr:hypothetical protein HanRHA438_Chr11g0500391 [Helianthus annuus]
MNGTSTTVPCRLWPRGSSRKKPYRPLSLSHPALSYVLLFFSKSNAMKQTMHFLTLLHDNRKSMTCVNAVIISGGCESGRRSVADMLKTSSGGG